MSTHNLGQKIFSVLALIILFSLLLSFFKQVQIYRRISKRLTEERKELQALEQKNYKLRQKLEAVKQGRILVQPSLFLETTSNDVVEDTEESNPKKWWKLFFGGK